MSVGAPIGRPPQPKGPPRDRKSPIPEKAKEEAKRSVWFVILILAVGAGLATSFYVTVSKEYVPINKRMIYWNNTDIQAIITIDDNLGVPIQSYFSHKSSAVSAALYLHKLPTFIKDVKLASNSKSILTVNNGTMELTDKSKHANTNISKATALEYTGIVEVGHTLKAKNYSEPYSIDINYRNNKTDAGPLIEAKIPFTWSISTLDFGEPSYFWIIFLGVVLSRVFTFSQDSESTSVASVTTHLKPMELLWVPFSAVITLLIFSSFKERVPFEFRPYDQCCYRIWFRFRFRQGI